MKFFCYLLTFSGILLLTTAIHAQTTCYSCHDFTTGTGWSPSPSASCGVGNCNSADCSETNCGGADRIPWSENLHPGIVLEQKAGRLLVKAVAARSPAEEAGIIAGDEIVTLNGMEPGFGCSRRSWDFERTPGFAILSIRRHSTVQVRQIRLAPYESFFPNGKTISRSDSPKRNEPIKAGAL